MVELMNVVAVAALCVATSAEPVGYRNLYQGSNNGPSVGPYPPLAIMQNQLPIRQVNQASPASFAQAGRLFANQDTSQVPYTRPNQIEDSGVWRLQRAREDSALQWAKNSPARDNELAGLNDEVAATEIREEIGSLFDIDGAKERYGPSAATQIAVELTAESAVANQGNLQIGTQQTTAQADRQARFDEQVVEAKVREEIGSLFDIEEAEEQYGTQRTAGQAAMSQIAIELTAESAVANQRAMQIGAQQQAVARQQSEQQAAARQQQQQVARQQAAARQQQQQAEWQQQQQVAAQAVARQQSEQQAAASQQQQQVARQQAAARQQQQQAEWQQQQQMAAQAVTREQQQQAAAQAVARQQTQQQVVAARQQQQQAVWQQQQQAAVQAVAKQRAYQQAQTTSANTVTQSQSGPGIIGLLLPGQKSSAVGQTSSVNQARQQYYQPADSISQTRLGPNQYQTMSDQSNIASSQSTLGGSRLYRPRLDQTSASQASSSSLSSSNSGDGRSKIVVFISDTGSNQAPIVEVVSPGQFGSVVEVIDPEKARNTGQKFGQQNRIAENILYQGIGVIHNFGL